MQGYPSKPPITPEVKVLDLNRDKCVEFVEKMRTKLHLNILSVESIEEALESDIVVIATPSRKPIVKKTVYQPRNTYQCHWADAKDKRELDTEGEVVAGMKI